MIEERFFSSYDNVVECLKNGKSFEVVTSFIKESESVEDIRKAYGKKINNAKIKNIKYKYTFIKYFI